MSFTRATAAALITLASVTVFPATISSASPISSGKLAKPAVCALAYDPTLVPIVPTNMSPVPPWCYLYGHNN